MPRRRRLVFFAVTLAAVLVAAVPVVLAVLLHGERLRFRGDLGRGSAIYLVLTFVYLVWLPGTIVLLVWVFDHLGYQYSLTERKQRPTRKERRRLRAGLSFLARRTTFGQGGGPAESDDRDEPQGDGSADVHDAGGS
jgi:hypothetical protein